MCIKYLYTALQLMNKLRVAYSSKNYCAELPNIYLSVFWNVVSHHGYIFGGFSGNR